MQTINTILVELASLASTRLLGAVVAAILVVIAGKLVIRAMYKAIEKTKVDATLQKFLISAVRVVIYFIAVMIVAQALGFEMSSLVALASVVSAAFALAASGVLSNLFGGILLLLTKPFGVSDYVIIGDVEGTVLEISILNTKINTLDNKRITVPNSTISSATIVNCSTEGKRRVDLVFNVGYDNDMERVKTAIAATAANHEKVIDKDSIFVRVSAYNDSTISYTMRVWTKTADYWDVYFDMMEQVKHTFDQVGITMVYPHMNVIVDQKKD
jgi:small conductance mechanosensitive channel